VTLAPGAAIAKDRFAVPQAEQAEINAIVASTRADIVV